MALENGAVERDEWSCAPAVGVGPLRFGMTAGEVAEAAETLGRTEVSECARDHAVFSPTRKVEVHRRGAASSPPAVTACVSRAAGLFCIAVDAVHGPQVAYDGLPLVGRDLSELESDVIACAEAVDVPFRYTPEGYAVPDDAGVVVRGQPVGRVLRSRPLFMVRRDGAHTERDSMPSEEYRVDGRSAT
ncbi:hypothetical protein [Streptomyces griseomycini]|uniref:Uncharacterized protein n=1 Tax=Streptomyces griseomycini TaxID=66895 RepID=A0A7W7PWS9_9ACTN|nr:hypothetical protein [Streptomyces griseomycini]MBB4902792.1 hypothetical protein [Streptomyces griseomycini]GGR51302.1 hypothetical protein GCM10015536_66000 [Streptomyces griseomycini]